MNKLHYVRKSISVLNCLLMLAFAASAYVVIVPYLNQTIQATLPAAKIAETAPISSQLESPPNPSQTDYTMISEKNLFHPERKIPPDNIVITATVIPKPELILYGTLISDNLSIAYVEDKKAPYSTPGRGTRQTQLKKGDNVSGYVLQDIEANRIVLVKGEDKLVVMLTSKEKKRAEETTKPVATTSSPGSPPAISAAPASTRPATSPAAAAPQATATAPVISGSPASTQGAKPPVQTTPSVTRPGQPYDPRRERMQNK